MNATSPTLRPARSRGQTNFDWLQSWHSFSFGRYVDRNNMGFGPLRVINDDIVAPGAGFGLHPHDNMEILTWMLAGSLKHADSTGNSGVIVPGDAQLMSAGRGIEHSEINASKSEPAHLLQIWIRPAQRDLDPAYQQKHFDSAGRNNKWQTIASPTGSDGSLVINQDATIRVTDLAAGASIVLIPAKSRRSYVHIATGQATTEDHTSLEAGDALTLEVALPITIRATTDTQILWFEFA
ncbi:MAG: pirin family protein [Phycisphaeraceae bacterium]|nr:pirin family protein [Phycisphaeraceae bacterium]MCW5763608.1 pirin family protein [Phycisphaeraceae bacterium]